MEESEKQDLDNQLEQELKNQIEHLSLLNYKFGKLIGLMSDFHMSNEEKIGMAELFDEQNDTVVIDKLCDAFYKNNEHRLTDEFKTQVIFEISKVIGYDFLSTLKQEQDKVVEYFNDIERAAKEEDFTIRARLFEIAERKRLDTINSVNNISGILNDFGKLYGNEVQ